MADEATGTTVEQTTQQPAAENAPASGRTYLQSDLDNIVAKVKESTAKQLREQWEAERAKEKMSEQERISAERDAEKAARLKAEAELSNFRRTAEVRNAAIALGQWDDVYLEREIASAADDADPAAIAKAAQEKFLASAAKFGKVAPAPTPRGGSIHPSANNDLADMSDADLNRLAIEKGAKFYNEHIKPEWDRRRRTSAGKH